MNDDNNQEAGMIYDTIIIGSGPAGLTAAIYATRAKLNMLVLDKNFISGGQMIDTYEVDNYPGIPGVTGMDLGAKFKEHAEALGAQFVRTKVKSVTRSEQGTWLIQGKKETYETKTVIYAAGAHHRKLDVPGEDDFSGMGVSYCATCDGAFYKDMNVVVVGGGNVAVEDAIFLARGSKQVYVVHRRDELRASKVLQEKLLSLPNVEMVWDSKVNAIEGSDQVETVVVENLKDGSVREISADGIFIAVGITPDSELLAGLVEMDKSGYIVADETCKTSAPGIFVAGDVRTKELRQIITAAADGANAVTSVERYLIEG